ncbi:MAG: 3-isopropylmalate dehydratase small subunit [Muribaculaceae bacterium]|nr:3-isopropylmalate dehydratase small subunit [Muribaculaceae bacterium]
MKEKFDVIISRCVPLPIENIDTDQIIPARFLKSTTREGFGENLFRDWRYDSEGRPVDGFVLNDPTYSGCVLVAGKNFGCGSSREHAAWAIHDYGFRVVVSSYFADIHKNNELNSFVLPVVVSPAFLEALFASIAADPSVCVRVDLPAQTITNLATGATEHFDINSYKKQCLLTGLDDVEYLLSRRDSIECYEKNQKLKL